MSWAARLIGWGLVPAAALAVAGLAARGVAAAGASAGGSALALLAQVAAVALLRPAMGAATRVFMGRWVAGMAVRGASVAALAALLLVSRETLPILWMVAGYLGVLLPLLFLEARSLR